MGNRLSKIYTRTGDDGSTGLGDGSRVAKENLRVEAYGTVDEVNSFIGVVLSVAALPPAIAGGNPTTLNTTPIVLLASSTVPYASTRRFSFGTRDPSPRPVLPSSPVRVYILLSRLPIVPDPLSSGATVAQGLITWRP